MKNIVAIDPSLVSTALVVSDGENFKIFNYCRESDVYTKTGMKKWFKHAEPHVIYRFIKYREFENYSEGELTKLKDYDCVTGMIIDDILSIINPNYETVIGIEGYNFGAQVGDLVDLVAFSSLLRKKLFDMVSEDIKVLSPSTLKLESCKLTYEPIVKIVNENKKNERKEYIYKNSMGISGGSFRKPEMFRCIVENDKLNDYWSLHCKSIKDEMLSLSNIPKPHEDIDDAFNLYNILK
jgi:hypothetical protein